MIRLRPRERGNCQRWSMARRFKPRITPHHGPIPARWLVPPYLRGLACQLCQCFFQDGEVHGELDLFTDTFTCRTRTLRITNRPSLALVKAS